MSDGYEAWVVTTDPEQLADLKKKSHELGSDELGQYAISLGLRPPHYVEGRPVSIETRVPSGYEGEPLLMWSGYFPSVSPGDMPPDDDDGDNAAIWASIGIGLVDASEVASSEDDS
ncbi:hypothetical protein AB0K52_14990 [Glycomyces sp. NPDC049804]|uniref:hypothetical protein n=1 Tax=Glycomyces sp. NPDC049804 TaxID=3154363 RepID=UPI00341FC861